MFIFLDLILAGPGSDESLPDNPRADDLAIARDQLPVGFVAEQQLCQPRDHQGVDESQQHRRDDGHQDCNLKILLHTSSSYASPTPVIIMSISLIPMNGMMMPPKP